MQFNTPSDIGMLALRPRRGYYRSGLEIDLGLSLRSNIKPFVARCGNGNSVFLALLGRGLFLIYSIPCSFCHWRFALDCEANSESTFCKTGHYSAAANIL